MDEETRSYIGFSMFPGIGPVRFKLLCDFFGSATKAWNASYDELRTTHLSEKLSREFVRFRNCVNLDAYIVSLHEKQIRVVPYTHSKYPALLHDIPDAPFLLYIRGDRPNTQIDMKKTIGVVGTRNITPYGVEVTRTIVRGLVQKGFTIVSGLAYGVDAVAHQAAIDTGGSTIAVLGCGVDVIAPVRNTDLYTAICNGHGAIVSEMPLGLRPEKGLFVSRNRIISGLSLGVVITECAEDSGALITARNAAEQGREVFAVPGPITSIYSKGPSRLLKNGAVLVEDVMDIIESLELAK